MSILNKASSFGNITINDDYNPEDWTEEKIFEPITIKKEDEGNFYIYDVFTYSNNGADLENLYVSSNRFSKVKLLDIKNNISSYKNIPYKYLSFFAEDPTEFTSFISCGLLDYVKLSPTASSPSEFSKMNVKITGSLNSLIKKPSIENTSFSKIVSNDLYCKITSLNISLYNFSETIPSVILYLYNDYSEIPSYNRIKFFQKKNLISRINSYAFHTSLSRFPQKELINLFRILFKNPIELEPEMFSDLISVNRVNTSSLTTEEILHLEDITARVYLKDSITQISGLNWSPTLAYMGYFPIINALCVNPFKIVIKEFPKTKLQGNLCGWASNYNIEPLMYSNSGRIRNYNYFYLDIDCDIPEEYTSINDLLKNFTDVSRVLGASVDKIFNPIRTYFFSKNMYEKFEDLNYGTVGAVSFKYTSEFPF